MRVTTRFDIKRNCIQAIKIALAAIIAILLADALNLQFAVSAGIVAILSVAFTKRETIQTAVNRFLAFAVALVIAAACFNLIGYDRYGFFAYLVLFIGVCRFMGWDNALAMDSVLISHFLTLKAMGATELTNEIGLFVIGVGIGIAANLFIRPKKDYMAKMKDETDALMKKALHRMSLRIVNPAMDDYDGSCFITLRKTLDEASALAHLNYMNQLTSRNKEDIEYIAMREEQSDTLYEIYKHLRGIQTVPNTAEMLSRFFEKVSVEYSMENTVDGLMAEYDELNTHMKEMPLPKDREEFEDRARLFAVMRGIGDLLYIKHIYVLKAANQRNLKLRKLQK